MRSGKFLARQIRRRGLQLCSIMAEFGPDVFTEHHRGQYRVSGFEVTTLLAGPEQEGGAMVLLKGGWTDPNSVSMRGLARTMFEASDGDIMVGIVGTTRPRRLGKAVVGSFDPLKHHAQSMYGAANYANDTFHPE